jgi:lactonase
MGLNGQAIRRLVMPALVAVLALALPAALAGAAGKSSNGGRTVYMKQLTRILPQGSEPVLFEGGAFGPDGRFYFADALAKPGDPKVIALDVKSKKWKGIYTDKTSLLVSTQFDSKGKLWVTDFGGEGGGAIASMNADGSDYTVTASGKVDGQPMHPDDISFDQQGNMFASDTSGGPFEPIGRIIRLDPTGTKASVLQDGIVAANGVSFTPDYSQLWVSEYTNGQDVLLTLNEDHTKVTEANVGMRANVGPGHFDSNMVDSAGNVYQCINERGEILVWSPNGELLETVKVKQNLGAPELSATNLAIKPGTKTAYVVVGGKAGGFVYTFPALAKGFAGSNGGSAK